MMKGHAPSRRDLLRTVTLLPAARAADAAFIDVAAQAGLARARNVSGAPSNKQFIIEEMGELLP